MASLAPRPLHLTAQRMCCDSAFSSRQLGKHLPRQGPMQWTWSPWALLGSSRLLALQALVLALGTLPALAVATSPGILCPPSGPPRMTPAARCSVTTSSRS